LVASRRAGRHWRGWSDDPPLDLQPPLLLHPVCRPPRGRPAHREAARMKPLLALAAVAALAAWLNVRDLLRAPKPQPDPLDTVQPADPWPPRATGGPVGRVQPFIVGESGPEWIDNRPYLDDPVLVRMRDAYRGNPL